MVKLHMPDVNVPNDLVYERGLMDMLHQYTDMAKAPDNYYLYRLSNGDIVVYRGTESDATIQWTKEGDTQVYRRLRALMDLSGLGSVSRGALVLSLGEYNAVKWGE